MKINLSDKIIAWLALLSGLTISAVAIWYSVAGLVSIFAAAVVPIIVMGVALEISKLIATVWLKLNWNRAPRFIRGYLLTAIAILMIITSMGIFGFLSKAHSDQSLVSGDVQSKIAIYDEKIKVARDNIDANRKALKQMDEAVDQVMGRSQDEKGADKAVALRRGQAKERTRLLSEIAAEQKAIAQLSEERAPIAAEVRKVEAEVGPIKYIASFIYGSNPDANVLEKAVTWVIIIIVSVFDPLAVILLLASQYSFQWFRTAREEEEQKPKSISDFVPQPQTLVVEEPAVDLVEEANNKLAEIEKEEPYIELPPKESEVDYSKHVYLNPEKSFWTRPEGFEPVPPQVYKPEQPAEVPVEAPVEEEDENIDHLADSEKTAIKLWKASHPESSIKLQRRLLEKGLITQLPWEEYLKPKEDFMDDATLEAIKWAQERMEERPGDYLPEDESKKKDSDLDGEGRGPSSEEKQGTLKGYVQNAEQSESTLWQRVQQVKK